MLKGLFFKINIGQVSKYTYQCTTAKIITLEHCYFFLIIKDINFVCVVCKQMIVLPVSCVELIDLKIARPP